MKTRSNPLNAFLERSGKYFFRFRNSLFPLFVISLFALIRPAYLFANSRLDPLAVFLGVVIALLGQGFRLFVIGFAYIKRGGKNGTVWADTLVADGIYAHVRNPMYIGNFLILSGIGIIYGSQWVYLLVIPFFAYIYLSIVVAEETYLRKRFGASYDDYCKRVPRFIPDFRGLVKSLQKFTYDWRKALRKDYGTLIGTAIGCYATWLWKQYRLTDFPRTKNELIVPMIILIAIAITYSFIRYLKKSGRLTKHL